MSIRRDKIMVGNEMAFVIPNEKRLRSARKLAAQAVKDFMNYGEKGYTQELLDAINKATSEAEIRDLLRKARAAA